MSEVERGNQGSATLERMGTKTSNPEHVKSRKLAAGSAKIARTDTRGQEKRMHLRLVATAITLACRATGSVLAQDAS